MSHQPQTALPPHEVTALARELDRLGESNSTPIPDALRAGSARVRDDAIEIPGVAAASSAAGIAATVRAMRPKAARVVAGTDGFTVQAKLNPWVSVETGNYLHGLADPHPAPADGTPHPTQPGVVWHNAQLSPFSIGSFGSSSAPDPDWTPHDAARRVMASSSSSSSTSMERTAASMSGTTRVDTGAGMVTASRGWGGQPRISSRKEEYGGAHAPTDYVGLGGILDGTADPEDAAHNMEMAAEDDDEADFSGLSHQQQRAASMSIGITQVAEEHPKRTPGSAAIGRAAFRAVSDGVKTFPESFSALPYAGKGGTKMMRDIKAGKRDLTDEQADMISALDEDEFGQLWPTPSCKWPPGGPHGGGPGGPPPPMGGAGGSMLST